MAYSRGRCLLQSLLDQANISQSELSRRSGISQRMISYYALDQKLMNYTAARKIADALNCKMEDLYEWLQ